MAKHLNVGDVVELDRDCDLGNRHERAVVVTITDDGKYMRVVFPFRGARNDRNVHTGVDYQYLRSV